ncbi:COP9 signalosome complex subunit 8-like [Rhopilema esculentum]|uniref:COP9 signalosome complex subunit 8-like n=1 Tax=Rhopilema esculentum TaxID=499914 RepID=UPI0031E0B85C
MADFEADIVDECRNLEEQDLSLENDALKTDVYSKLLAIYILQNDLVHAKFLWKRLPENVKSTTPHLELLWKVGQLLWTRNFAAAHLALNQEWPPEINKYIQTLKEKLRERVKNLVSKAYLNIRIGEFANLLGMTEQDAIEVARQKGWQIDIQSRFIHPKAQDSGNQTEVSQQITSEQQLACLTDYISYLEN